MRIKIELESIHSFARFRELIQDATPNITFWGWRHISIPFQGRLEKVPIELLAERVSSLASEKHFEYPFDERLQGDAVVAKISALYKMSDEVLRRSFFLTRIFCAVREFFKEWEEKNELGHITFRTQWEVYDTRLLNYFTPKQFQENYGLSPEQVEAQVKGLRYRIDVLHFPLRYRIAQPMEPSIDSAGNVWP